MHTERSSTRRRAEPDDERTRRAEAARAGDEALPLVERERAICDVGHLDPERERGARDGDVRERR